MRASQHPAKRASVRQPFLDVGGEREQEPEHRWSLLGAFDHLWNHDQTKAYYGQSLRQNPYPLTTNDLLNAGPEEDTSSELGGQEFRHIRRTMGLCG